MTATLNKQVAELVRLGWEPRTQTETSASLSSRGPFGWWLFIFVVIVFPVVGGLLYLVFWYLTSRVTVFLYEEEGELKRSGATWMIDMQLARTEALIEEQDLIREQGFWKIMWPKLLVLFLFLMIWIGVFDWIF